MSEQNPALLHGVARCSYRNKQDMTVELNEPCQLVIVDAHFVACTFGLFLEERGILIRVLEICSSVSLSLFYLILCCEQPFLLDVS